MSISIAFILAVSAISVFIQPAIYCELQSANTGGNFGMCFMDRGHLFKNALIYKKLHVNQFVQPKIKLPIAYTCRAMSSESLKSSSDSLREPLAPPVT